MSRRGILNRALTSRSCAEKELAVHRRRDSGNKPGIKTTAQLGETSGDEASRGEARPFLIVLSGPAAGEMHRLSKRGAVLGRAADADLVLPDDGISRYHARIEHQAGVLVVVDQGSRNGVFVNDERVKRQELRNGDRLRMGSATIIKISFQDDVEETFLKQLSDSAMRDALTQVYNKRFLQHVIQTEFAYHSRQRESLSVLILDIDHFKRINDRCGHVLGDQALKRVAQTTKACVRNEDVVCRYGGEEFAVILRDTSSQDAVRVAERIRLSVAHQDADYKHAKIAVTVSLGVATSLDRDFACAEDLLREADKHLYSAKRLGRNRAFSASSARGKPPTLRPSNADRRKHDVSGAAKQQVTTADQPANDLPLEAMCTRIADQVARCGSDGPCFSLLVAHLPAGPNSAEEASVATRRAQRIVLDRLRSDDSIAVDRAGRLIVLLPTTTRDHADSARQRIAEALVQASFSNATVDILGYPEDKARFDSDLLGATALSAGACVAGDPRPAATSSTPCRGLSSSSKRSPSYP